MAAHYRKHMIVEKPLAMSIDDCTAMVEAAHAAGVQLMAGHTHSFDAPVRAMAELVGSGDLGELLMVNTWNFNDFNRRPWPTSELRSTSGPVLNQGPHQVDIVRQIVGGLARTVRASTIWDDVRECVGDTPVTLDSNQELRPRSSMTAEPSSMSRSCTRGWRRRRPPQPPSEPAGGQQLRSAQSGPRPTRSRTGSSKEQGRYGAATTTEESQELWGYSARERSSTTPTSA